MEEGWLTEEELLAMAADADFTAPELTPRKIERWRKARLLPHPQLISLGRGQGMRSEYPPGTARQLLALCRHRRRFPHDLDAVRFALWYEGYPVLLDDVKQAIEQLVKPFQPVFTPFAAEDADPLDAAEQMVKQAEPKLSRSKWGRQFKRLLDGSETDAVMTAMFQLWQGAIPGFAAHAEEELGERSLTEIFLEVTGLKRAQTDRIGEVAPWLPADTAQIGKDLENLAAEQVLSFPALLQTLREASPKEFAQARADLAHMSALKQVTKGMEALVGPNPFGFGNFRELPGDPGFLAWFLLVLMRLRIQHGAALDEIGAMLQKARPVFQRMEAILKALGREYPAIAEEIIPQAQNLNLSDPQAFDRIHALFVASRAAHPEELDAFFRRHPDLMMPAEGI
jgi:hypothetical protein